METIVPDVRDMQPVLSVPGVERRIGEVPGVESVTVNFAAGNATVRFDETRLDIAAIRSGVRQRAHEAGAGNDALADHADDDPQAPSVQPATVKPVATRASTPPTAVAVADATPSAIPKSAPEAAPAAADAPLPKD